MKFYGKGRTVVFKQRTVIKEGLSWEYQDGQIIRSDRGTKIAEITWLHEYQSRTDFVPFEDIVAVNDNRCKVVTIGTYSFRGRILQEIVEEGTCCKK